MRSLCARHGATLCWWSGALAIAWALKHHYSVATPRDLDWMLRPVALLLQFATGRGFSPSPEGEWFSVDAGIVLVKACAGVNFMLMSFLGWCWLLQPGDSGTRVQLAEQRPPLAATLRWPLRLAAAVSLAWLTALLVNVARILLASTFGHTLGALFGAADAHRMIGLAVYLPALTGQLLLAGRARRGPALVLAATLYLALMLATPLLTGAARAQPALYFRHAVTLLAAALPLLAWGLWLCRRRPQATTLAVRGHTGHNRHP